MHILRRIAVGLFIAAVPVFLIATSVRWVINAPILYSYGFDRYDIPSRTGIERPELISAGRQIRDYFGNGEEYLVVSAVRYGVEVPSLYNSREVLHMKDVKGLVRGVYRAQEVTGVYLLAFAAVGLWLGRRAFLPAAGPLRSGGRGLDTRPGRAGRTRLGRRVQPGIPPLPPDQLHERSVAARPAD